MIPRPREIQTLRGLLRRHRVVGIIGARQVGKTTLARQVTAEYPHRGAYFDLEDPDDVARLAEPMLVLRDVRGLVVIDEIQRMPDLYPVLRVLGDRPRSSTRFLVLGGASPELLRQTSETLAGRIIYHRLQGLALDEVGDDQLGRLWLRGGFPRSFTARTLAASAEWRRGFIGTFLERDLPAMGINIAATALRRFWSMLAHYHGQLWNSSEFARSFGVADTTVRHYLDLLTAALVVRQLPPWHENLAKRQVKAPKVYVADSGLLHTLLDVTTQADLERHPKMGASWEGFVLAEVVRCVGARWDECYFWATHSGAELDLLIVRGRKRLGFEIKRAAAPKVTPSIRSALADLRLSQLCLIHAGRDAFPLGERILAIPVSRMRELLPSLRGSRR